MSDREERGERKPQKPIRYTYRYQQSAKTPEIVGGTIPVLGCLVGTKDGPAKVLEVFWRSATDADVLLRPVETQTMPEKLAAKDAVKKLVTGPVRVRKQNRTRKVPSKKGE
jgi:hypothetical protein